MYEDEDLYTSLSLDWGGAEDRVSASVHWRGVRDLDGPSWQTDDPFHSVYDAYGDGWWSQLFCASLDLRGAGSLTRLGRQFMYEDQPFHFDGARYVSPAARGGLRAHAFGGVPVHFFEASSRGDWLAGLGLELRPWPGGRASLLYTRIEEDVRFLGLPEGSEADDLLVFRVATRLSDWGTALVRHTAVDGDTRDLLFRARTFCEAKDSGLSLSYYRQPAELSEFTLDLSPYHLVQGASHPFERLDLSASKGFGANDWRVGLEARGAARRLLDPVDEGEYNRDYEMLWLGLEIDSPGRRRFSATAGHAWWRSSGDDFRALDAALDWAPSEELRLGLGTTYSLFRYSVFTLSERRDVREAFLRVRWRPREGFRLRLRYANEDEAGERTHKVRLGCTLGF